MGTPLPPDNVLRIIEDMEAEFLARRKLTISGLPPHCDSDSVSIMELLLYLITAVCYVALLPF